MAPAVNRATGNDTMPDELAEPGPLTRLPTQKSR